MQALADVVPHDPPRFASDPAPKGQWARRCAISFVGRPHERGVVINRPTKPPSGPLTTVWGRPGRTQRLGFDPGSAFVVDARQTGIEGLAALKLVGVREARELIGGDFSQAFISIWLGPTPPESGVETCRFL